MLDQGYPYTPRPPHSQPSANDFLPMHGEEPGVYRVVDGHGEYVHIVVVRPDSGGICVSAADCTPNPERALIFEDKEDAHALADYLTRLFPTTLFSVVKGVQ